MKLCTLCKTCIAGLCKRTKEYRSLISLSLKRERAFLTMLIRSWVSEIIPNNMNVNTSYRRKAF